MNSTSRSRRDIALPNLVEDDKSSGFRLATEMVKARVVRALLELAEHDTRVETRSL